MVTGVWAGPRGVYECMGMAKQLHIIAGRRRRLNVHARMWEGRGGRILGILVCCQLVAICEFEDDKKAMRVRD